MRMEQKHSYFKFFFFGQPYGMEYHENQLLWLECNLDIIFKGWVSHFMDIAIIKVYTQLFKVRKLGKNK